MMSQRVECDLAHACTRAHTSTHARTRIRQINIKRSSDIFSIIFWIIISPHGILCTTSLVTTIPIQFSSVQSLSRVRLCDPMNRSTQASLSITSSRSLLRLVSVEWVMPSSHLTLCRPLLLLPPIPPS